MPTVPSTSVEGAGEQGYGQSSEVVTNPQLKLVVI